MSIPTSLLDCYSNATLLSRQGLPPFGIGQFIDLVRKAESSRFTQLDLKNMAVQMTHRFRQDGIRKSPNVVATDGVVPYTPSGPEFFRHQILLKKLIPGNAYNFPNNTLSTAEQCALHFMMSTTVDDFARQTEGTECSNLKNYETDTYGSSGGGSSGGYQSGYGGGYQGGWGGGYSSGVNYRGQRPQVPTRGPRRTRQAREAKPGPGIESDVEIINPALQAEVDKTRANYANYAHSKCPIQGGVVFTPWGAVTGGSVVAGIAAGLVPQSVAGEVLAMGLPRSRYYTQRGQGRGRGLASDTAGLVDNKWAATFSGDLAQVALLQGPANEQGITVGLFGGWNTTIEPKHYILSQLSEGAMSEAAVRGCIDGLVLGSYVSSWYSQSGSYLKLSQLLDMYYSERGVFDRNTRACLRRERFSDVATTASLDAQTEAFSKFYGTQNPFTVTLADDVITRLSDTAVNKLQNFIPSLNDPVCVSGTTDLIVRAYVDIVLVLDTSLQYEYMHPAIAYLMDKTEAGRYGSLVMVLNGKDGSILFNSSYPRLDWHTNFTQQNYEQAVQRSSGFDVMVALNSAIQRLRETDLLRYQRRQLGGRGQVVLYVTAQGLGSGYDQNSLWDRLSNFRQLYPDVEQLVLTQGNKNAFAAITNDTNRDVFTFSPSDPANSILPLVARLKTVPRRIRNPNCNADWIETGSGNSEMVDYVEPLGVNYYRITPNNFYRTTDEWAKIRVTSQGYGSLTLRIEVFCPRRLSVCWSQISELQVQPLVRHGTHQEGHPAAAKLVSILGYLWCHRRNHPGLLH